MQNFEKLKIPQKFIIKWKDITHTLSEIIDVNIVFITRTKDYESKILQYFSQLEENTFKKEDKLKLMENKKKEVSLKWPDENIFGSIVLCNKKDSHFSKSDEKILKYFKELIESHLEIIVMEEKFSGDINKDFRKQKNIENELKNEKKFLNKILNIQGAIVIVLDPEGKIIRFNNESQKITGYSEKEVLNNPFWDIFLAEKEKNEVKSVFKNIVGDKDFPNEYKNHIKTKNDELRLISWKNTAVLENGKVKYVIATGLDITEQRQRMDKLKEQRQKLNDANQQLTAYLEEITAMNEELESSLDQVNELNKRFSNMVKVISGLIEHQNDKDIFLSEILESAIEIVPEADYGKILSLNEEKQKWEFVDTIGHNIDNLKNIKLDKELFPELHKKEVIYDSNYSININKLTENKKVILKDAFKAIEKSLYTNIKIDEEPVGRLVLDIAKGSNEEFTKVSEKILRSFSNLASAFFSYRRYNNLQGKFTKEMITSIVQILELYDKYTKGHSENVAKMAAKIAEEMDLSQKKINDAYWTGMVHDIGKLLVSLDILNKTGSLNDKEYETIKKHPYWGYKALSSSKTLEDIAHYVLYHHERWDGKGYPEGLKKEEIPLLSQILGVADAWDAMTSDRSYREPLSQEKAIKELRKNKGKQFSPKIVEITLENNIL